MVYLYKTTSDPRVNSVRSTSDGVLRQPLRLTFPRPRGDFSFFFETCHEGDEKKHGLLTMYTPLKINVGQFCISFVGYVRFFWIFLGYFYDFYFILGGFFP